MMFFAYNLLFYTLTTGKTRQLLVKYSLSFILPENFTPNGRPKRGRKRKISDQSRTDRKRRYNNNETHVNTKGNIVTEKKFDENFVCPCLNKCTNNVLLEYRRRIFNQFRSMGSFAGDTLSPFLYRWKKF